MLQILFIYLFFLIGVQLLYNVVLVSAVQQSESAVCIHISPLSWTYLPSPHPRIPPSHPSRSPQSTELSSVHYTAVFWGFFCCCCFGCDGSSLLRGLSVVAASRVYSSLWCVGFSLQWLLLLWNTGSRRVGFSSCGTQAQLLHSMWDLPGPGIEPMSPALAGRFLKTVPPGCSYLFYTIRLSQKIQ